MKFIYLFSLLAFSSMAKAQNTFKKEQLKFERVRTAYSEKWDELQKSLTKQNFIAPFSLLINAYKAEGKLEIWLKNNTDKKYSLFRTYDFCEHSGTLGPKIKEGDLQTPEGFYSINVFNPMSSFYLSLGIDYPNAVDLVRTGKNQSPGSDIYIHGDCVTVGCIPLTDEKIKEMYVLAVEARNGGQEKIPVQIFPFKMTSANMKKYADDYPSLTNFWKTLEPGYAYFEKHKIPAVILKSNGAYSRK
ncbi:L,D-transpeptidase family protein [Pedobacter sp. MW01-1-1]|uniref:L,D-transpeptidase family protein n=1 Tax=Pedobacter sp. MW01-1-1 TaxID=3383027 RepID=UPI003FEE3DC2